MGRGTIRNPQSPINMATNNPAEALTNFLAIWSDGILLDNIGPHLNCTEAEALADLLRAYGENAAAESLLDGHCVSDDEGDAPDHFARKNMLEKNNTPSV